MILLLILSGDIETNPGPMFNDSITNIHRLSVVHLNIRSIRNKTDFIPDHLSDFHIMCFTKTHL